jgi:cell division protein FtsI (penicillin-binding protein 3)
MTRDVDRDVALARRRLRLFAGLFALVFIAFGVRLMNLALSFEDVVSAPAMAGAIRDHRADIVDRNGVLLATDYPKPSVFADPKEILDPAAAAAALAPVLGGTDVATLTARLSQPGRFVWLKRHVTDAEQRAIVRLGLPGIGFRTEPHRVYPQRALASHVVGFVGVENQGLAGIERSFDQRLRGPDAVPLALTLDLRVQEVVRSALAAAVDRFRADGGSGLVLDAASGEVLAMVSLPDFDPNRYQRAQPDERFNRNTQGTYELGSLFKVFTAAMALDAGAVRLTGGFDASEPLVVRPHRIHDFHAKRRWLSVPEIVAFSSNIGAAKMADALGMAKQQAYFERLGLLGRHPIRLPEVGTPQLPAIWRPINTITAAYGHGIAVSPLQVVDALAAVLCGGPRRTAHLVAEAAPPPDIAATVSRETSAMLRWLMWLVVEEGTGGSARVPGYLVGGKTGSADQVGAAGYGDGGLLSSFVAAFPIERPRYVVLVTLDQPEGDEATYGQAHGGWTAAPTVRKIISRIGPLLGVAPSDPDADRWFRERLVETEAFNGRLERLEASFTVAPGADWTGSDRGSGSCGCATCSIVG